MVKGDVKEGKKINVGASASVLPSPDDAVVDLSLHGRGKGWGELAQLLRLSPEAQAIQLVVDDWFG